MDPGQLLTQMNIELNIFYALAQKVGYCYAQFGTILQYKFLCADNFQRHQSTALPTTYAATRIGEKKRERGENKISQ
jgi:hypothetical protein